MENEQDKGWEGLGKKKDGHPYHQKEDDKNQELRREKDLQMFHEKQKEE